MWVSDQELGGVLLLASVSKSRSNSAVAGELELAALLRCRGAAATAIASGSASRDSVDGNGTFAVVGHIIIN